MSASVDRGQSKTTQERNQLARDTQKNQLSQQEGQQNLNNAKEKAVGDIQSALKGLDKFMAAPGDVQALKNALRSQAAMTALNQPL